MQSTFKPTQGLLMPFCSPNRILMQEPLTQSAAAGGRRNTKPSPRRGTGTPQQGARRGERMAGGAAFQLAMGKGLRAAPLLVPWNRCPGGQVLLLHAAGEGSEDRPPGHRLPPRHGDTACTLLEPASARRVLCDAGRNSTQKRCSQGVTSVSNRDLISAERHYIVIWVK